MSTRVCRLKALLSYVKALLRLCYVKALLRLCSGFTCVVEAVSTGVFAVVGMRTHEWAGPVLYQHRMPPDYIRLYIEKKIKTRSMN